VHDFPFGYASGWYQFGWSGEFAPGAVKPLLYFDTPMVAYRTEGGTLVLSHAVCPHLGAHLGLGGCVEGENLVCPFHGWKWSTEGRNVDIPYSAPDRMKLRIPQYEVREIDGIALMWYGAEGEQPSWEPPRLLPEDSDLEADFYPLYPDCAHLWPDMRFPPQFPAENAGDAAHFRYVHLAAEVPDVDHWEEGDFWFETSFRTTFGGHAATTWATPNGPVDGLISTKVIGLGLAKGVIGSFDEVHTLQTTTPVTRRTSDHRASLWVPRKRGDGSPLDEKLRDRWAKQQFTQHERDFPVWENVTYIAKPPFAATEAVAFRALRRWIENLYPSEAPEPASTGGR
jgi:3-ketosteroid 9alpha-monooxygenase subunit A